MPRRLTVALLLLISLAAGDPAAGQLHSFDRLSRQQGLSQISINVIHQDRTGFMWFGTQDGLNRWDGYEMVVFKHDPEDPDSISQNLVLGLHEDLDGRLWVVSGMAGLIDRFDPETSAFERLANDPDDPASILAAAINTQALVDDGEGHLWAGTFGGGVNKISKADGTVTRIVANSGNPESLSNDNISSIVRDGSGNLWIGTFGGGLHRRLPPSSGGEERFAVYRHDADDDTSLSHDVVTALFVDRGGELWVGTGGGGINRFDSERDAFRAYTSESGVPTETAGGIVAVATPGLAPMVEDEEGGIWIVGTQGVARLDLSDGSLRHYLNDPDDPRSLSNNLVSAVHCDRTGSVWVGTQGGGLNVWDPETDSFSVHRTDPSSPRSLSSDFMTEIYESRSGRLWFGSNNAGISAFSRAKHKFHHYARTSTNGLRDNMVFAILQDRRGDLWVGTLSGGLHRFDGERSRTVERYFLAPGTRRDLGNNFVRALLEDQRGRIWAGTVGGGLARIDPGRGVVTRRYVNDPSDPRSLANNNVFGIYEDRRQQLWIATGNGWCRFDPDSERFTTYRNIPGDPFSLVNSFTRFTYEDREGKLWVGTAQGLSRFDPESERFSNYVHDVNDPSTLSQNNIMDVFQDEDQTIWIATYGGGLNRLDPVSGRIDVYTTRDGLPNDSLYSLLPDDRGDLWISTNNGLSRFDPRNETFSNFDVDDGLQSNEFNGRAFSRSSHGEMFFGGTRGFNSFVPSGILPDSYVPPVILTGFRKFGQPVDFERSMQRLERIDLSYKDNYIAFEFAALDFNKPTKTRYAYKLEGFDRDWIENGNRRVAHYTNLSGGNYTFRVRGANGDGIWNDAGAAVRVVVVPPPWKTWWAYAIYALMIGGGVLGYVRIKTRSHEDELRRQREEAENRRKTEELDQARQIQLSMVPAAPPTIPGLEIAAFMETATEVGGDYYDFAVQPDGSLFATIGDATGHGIRAGMMVAMTKSALRALEVAPPETLLNQLNRILRMVYPDRMMMALNIVHLVDDRVAISSAGMPPALIYRGDRGVVEEVLVAGLPLGSLEEADYSAREILLDRGDVLLLFSDGLPEATDEGDRVLGYDAVEACLLEHGTESAESIRAALVELGRGWTGSGSHRDDITLLVFKKRA